MKHIDRWRCVTAMTLALLAASGALGGPVTTDGPAAPRTLAPESALLGAEADRFAALRTGDVPTIAAGLAEDLVYIHGSGAVQSKSQYVAALTAGGFRYRGIDVLEQSGHIDGEIGITHGVLKLSVSTNLELLNRYTGVYRRVGEHWLLLSWQTTDIRPTVAAPAPTP